VHLRDAPSSALNTSLGFLADMVSHLCTGSLRSKSQVSTARSFAAKYRRVVRSPDECWSKQQLAGGAHGSGASPVATLLVSV
jgi:hypothetical protein